MSDRQLLVTIRRCTALLLIVLGAIAVELASLEYPDGGDLVGGGAIFAGCIYLLGSAFVEFVTPDDQIGLAEDGGPDGENSVATGDGKTNADGTD